MKLKIKLAAILLFLSFIGKSNATIHQIQASGFSFTPNSVNANVGDTIKWLWVDGMHNTISTSVPSGAQSWNAPLDNTDTQFIYKITTPGQYSYECSFHVALGMTGTINVNPIGIKPISGVVPEKYNLYQNYPNPFNPSTNIKFDVPVSSHIKLAIYSLTGSIVVTLVNDNLAPGSYSVEWDASKYASGLYLYVIEATGFTSTKKLMLVK